MKYKFLEHTADIKFRAYGQSANEVFAHCALAMSEYVSRGEQIAEKKQRKIAVSGEDAESLLYAFLDELIYLLDAKRFVAARAVVKVSGNKLTGMVFGDDAKHYKDLDHIKAATYAEMYIKQKKNGQWEAQVVLDV